MKWCFWDIQKWSLSVGFRGIVLWTSASVNDHHANLSLLCTSVPYILMNNTSKTLPIWSYSTNSFVFFFHGSFFILLCLCKVSRSILPEAWVSPKHIYPHFQVVPTEYAFLLSVKCVNLNCKYSHSANALYWHFCNLTLL